MDFVVWRASFWNLLRVLSASKSASFLFHSVQPTDMFHITTDRYKKNKTGRYQLRRKLIMLDVIFFFSFLVKSEPLFELSLFRIVSRPSESWPCLAPYSVRCVWLSWWVFSLSVSWWLNR